MIGGIASPYVFCSHWSRYLRSILLRLFLVLSARESLLEPLEAKWNLRAPEKSSWTGSVWVTFPLLCSNNILFRCLVKLSPLFWNLGYMDFSLLPAYGSLKLWILSYFSLIPSDWYRVGRSTPTPDPMLFFQSLLISFLSHIFLFFFNFLSLFWLYKYPHLSPKQSSIDCLLPFLVERKEEHWLLLSWSFLLCQVLYILCLYLSMSHSCPNLFQWIFSSHQGMGNCQLPLFLKFSKHLSFYHVGLLCSLLEFETLIFLNISAPLALLTLFPHEWFSSSPSYNPFILHFKWCFHSLSCLNMSIAP